MITLLMYVLLNCFSEVIKEVEDVEDENSRREVAFCVANLDIGKTTAEQRGHRKERRTGWSRHD